MKVMITGGAGFIGAHLAAHLSTAGAHVAVLDNMSASSDANLAAAYHAGLRPADVFVLDICSAESTSAMVGWRPDVLVHLAAVSRVTDSIRDPAKCASVNVVGTLNILMAAAQAGVRKVVAASSGGTVYGDLAASDLLCDETFPRRPVSPYGASKAAADLYLHMYQRTYGLPSTVLMLGNVYGQRIDGLPGPDLISRSMNEAQHGRPPLIYGDGTQTRDFVHVSDVVNALHLACSTADNECLNVGTGRETSVHRVVQLVCEALGTAQAVRYEPAQLGEANRVRLDIARAREVMRWQPEVRLEDGLAALAAELPVGQHRVLTEAAAASPIRSLDRSAR